MTTAQSETHAQCKDRELMQSALEVPDLTRRFKDELSALHTKLRGYCHKRVEFTAHAHGQEVLRVLNGVPGSDGCFNAIHSAAVPDGGTFTAFVKTYGLEELSNRPYFIVCLLERQQVTVGHNWVHLNPFNEYKLFIEDFGINSELSE
ncbi:MAG TPA: hypothetical protein VLF21_02515 [Candidatus Saccharimonadales bacterium]|nr:hypothetical protein [Candidatus Saccharimonadales bacterium]